MGVPFYIHNINDYDKQRLIGVIESGFLTTGEVVKEFEDNFAKHLKVKYTIGTSSWTAAAEVVLRYWGVKSGDEVILPSLTYVATAQAISRVGATPVFVDSDPRTGLINLDLVEEAITNKTRAIIPVHLYGAMVDMQKLQKISAGKNIKILEDASHAIESSINDIRPANLSDAACFSFYATKNIACGEGGAIATNDSNLNEYARRAIRAGTTKGVLTKSSEGFFIYDSTIVATKANMTNIQASLLIGQLNRINNSHDQRTKLYSYYTQRLKKIDSVKTPHIPLNCVSAFHLLVILVPSEKRASLLKFLQQRQIGFGVHYPATHLLTLYKNQVAPNRIFRKLKIAESWSKKCVTLPFYPKITKEDIDEVVDTLEVFFE